MKQQLSPAVTITVIVVVVIVAVVIGWKVMTPPDYSNAKQSSAKIVMPDSQKNRKF
jgi:hypothetical protein